MAKKSKKKLKILAVPANEGGCSYYRIIMPMNKLQENHPDEVEVKFDFNPLGWNKDEEDKLSAPSPNFEPSSLEWADIVFTQNIANFGGKYTLDLIHLSKEMGKFVHYDTDDLLIDLYEGHRLFDVYQNQGLSDLTKLFYYNADLVTVTQRKFADRVAPYVRGTLAVMRNAIDFKLPCWNQPKIPSPRKKTCRVGWVGGIHHEEDVKEYQSVILAVNNKVGAERVHWGFYGRPPMPFDDEGKPAPDWQQDVWKNYEKILTRGVKHRNFGVYQAMPSSEYGRMYQTIDVSIAPLQMNAFNDSKSEIKLMECGRYEVPLIASDVGCYSDIIKNGHNGYLVPPDNPQSVWVKYMTRIIKDREHREELGRNLKKTVDDHYDINKFTDQRLELYHHLLQIRDEIHEQQQS